MKSNLLRVVAVAGLLLVVFLLGVPPSTFAGICTAPTGAVGWASATWTGGCTGLYSGHAVPGNGDDVIIPTGSTVTLAINSTTTPAAPTLNSASITGVLTMGHQTNGNWGELIASGNVVINSGGTLDTTNATGQLTNYVRYGGSFVNNGTFHATSTGGDDVTIVTQFVPPTPTPTSAPDNRPNIVFILTDDQANYDPTNMQDDMPNLKSLIIQQGLTFNKNIVSIPLCCPSRATNYTGRYAHNTMIYDLGAVSGGFNKFYSLGEESSTVATWLQAAGYRTALFGKYLNGYPNSGQQTYIPPGWSEWASPSSDAAYTQFNYSLNSNGTLVAYGSSSNPANYMGDVLSGKATDFISRTVATGKPFFVNVTTYSPHVASASSPAVPAPRHANLFPGLTAPRTPNWNEADMSDKPNWIKSTPLLSSGAITEIDSWYRKRVQSLQSVDDMILSIVNLLKANGKFNNTYIFISSDNGYHMGNHRMVEGKESAYEEDVRVPMWVIGPGVPAGQTRDHLTINCDFAPTFAELGGVTPPANVDGHSLVPLLGSNPPSIANWRSAVLLEHGVTGPSGPVIMGQVADPLLLEPEENWWLPPAGRLAPQNEVAAPSGIYSGVRTNDYKYVEYKTGERELYDLRTDPYELQNIYSSVSPSLQSSLSSLVATLHTCSGANCWVTNQPTAVTLSSFAARADDWADNLLFMGLVVGIGSIAFAGVWLRRRR